MIRMNIKVEIVDGDVVVTWPIGEEQEFVGTLAPEEAFELCSALFQAALALARPPLPN
jgi:hypothetical protein